MIYLDNSATTPLCESAKARMLQSFSRFGNPSSMHQLGLEAEKDKQAAADAIRASLSIPRSGWKDWMVLFTSGGTEANNLALQGIAKAKKWPFRPQILISDSEHACIMEPAAKLEQEGFEVIRLRTVGGQVDREQMLAALCPRSILLSVMAVNNETGAIYEVGSLFAEAKRRQPSLLCHTDAVQAYMKIPISAPKLKADLITLSAHKIHGPKGCGALICREALVRQHRLEPLVYGGGQEGGIRSGTENTPGICGFWGAVEECGQNFAQDAAAMVSLRDYLLSHLPVDHGYRATLSPSAAPHIISIVSPRIKSETLLHFLSSKGICVSSGSACSSHGGHGSYVLKAFGLSNVDADCSIRISLSPANTREEVDALLDALTEADKTLVKIR